MKNVERDLIQITLPFPVIILLVTATVLGAMAAVTIISLRSYMNSKEGCDQGSMVPKLDGITKIIWRGRIRNQRPRVLVNGPEVKSHVCQICLGRIKEGSNHLECNCGRTFHIICLSRTGFCPYCHEPYENLIPQTGNIQSFLTCPLCGINLEPGSRRCECGAIFQEEGVDFCCPICGTQISEENTVCPYCGEIFDCYRLINCPVCGLLIDEDTEVCDCGAVLIDRCPGCGAPLGPEDRYCISCGAEFEFI
jgi:hypothetical protein